MSKVIQAKCPGCRNILRLPADWIGQSVRCKHCGKIIQAKKKPSDADEAGPVGQAAPGVITTARPPGPAVPPANPVPVAAAAPVNPMAVEPIRVPPPAAIAAVGHDEPFGQLAAASEEIVPRYRRKRGSGRKVALVILALLALIAGSAAVIVAKKGGPGAVLARLTSTSSGGVDTGHGGDGTIESKAKPAVLDLPHLTKAFPRRMLAISVNNYLYFNPVNYGEGDQSVGGVLRRMGADLHIPEDQIIELSDGCKDPHTPLKPVIEQTITDFLDSSRPEDRIIILFSGHALAIDTDAYLVPIEGEQGLKETLISLSWVYDQLAKCKARQKVLIMDVCRYDPSRGLQRPTSGPMADKVDEALQKPPPGVQVWSACVASQYSYESDLFISNGTTSRGGIFMGALWEAVGPFSKRVELGIQKPDDALPIAMLAHGNDDKKGVDSGTEGEVDADFKFKQTPRLVGDASADGAPYNPDEPMPPKLAVKPPPTPAGGAAPDPLIESILTENGALTAKEGTVPLTIRSMPLFDAKVMAPYMDEGPEKSAFRQTLVDAVALLDKSDKTYQEEFRGSGANADVSIKKLIFAQQEVPARALAELKDMEDQLTALEPDREDQPRRWQITYDYVSARIMDRIAYTYEYDFMLGQIRKDSLPSRHPAKSSGWRLAPKDKLQSGSEAKNQVVSAKKLLKKLATAKATKGTPWEILAKRETLTSLGLEWQVILGQ